LRIVSNLISCGTLEESDPELYIKSEWRFQFLENQGLSYLQNLFFDISEQTFLKQTNHQTYTQKSNNTEARILSLIIDILNIYIQPALISSSSELPRNLLNQVLTYLNNEKIQNDNDNKKNQNQIFNQKLKIDTKKEKETSIWDETPNDNEWPSIQRRKTPDFGWSSEVPKNTSPPKVIPLPPPGEGSLWDRTFKQNTNDQKEEWNTAQQIDEAQTFLKAIEEDNGKLATKILESIKFEDFIEKGLRTIEISIDKIDNDKDLAKLLEEELIFMLPCFIAYPHLLKLLYQCKEIQYISKMTFFRCKNEKIISITTYMIIFLSKNSQKNIVSGDDVKQRMELEIEEIVQDDGVENPKNDISIEEIGEEEQNPPSFFLKTLLPLAYNCQIEDDIRLEYFEIIATLIKMMNKGILNTITDLSRLYIFAIKFIKERPIFENRSSEVSDNVLRGFVKLAETLVTIDPKLQYIFDSPNQDIIQAGLNNLNLLKDLYDFLFYLPSENEKVDPALNLPKCKHKMTRAQVFKFIKALSANNEHNLKRILNLLSLNHQSLPKISAENTTSTVVNFELKSTTGYVGLKNMGCTCYMNSLIQQFFMIIPLRNALLSSEVNVKIPGPIDDQEEEVFLSQISKEVYEQHEKYIESQLTDNVLYQLQNLLGQLEESVSESVVPQKFFDSIKTINGEKIVVNVQQDNNI